MGWAARSFLSYTATFAVVHSRVIPAESYAGLADRDARLRVIAQLQQKAESLEAEVKERSLVEERLRLALVGEQMARAEAETANRMKDEFLATVSHEIRTPLNAIIGWSHLLRSGRLDQATAARAVETIDRNAKSQAQLIEDILDASRIVTGKLRLNNEPVDIASVINAAIDSVQLAIDSKGTASRSNPRPFGAPHRRRLQSFAADCLEPAGKCNQVHAFGRAYRSKGRARRREFTT